MIMRRNELQSMNYSDLDQKMRLNLQELELGNCSFKPWKSEINDYVYAYITPSHKDDQLYKLRKILI